jgi:carboxyl-terminal processing protease
MIKINKRKLLLLIAALTVALLGTGVLIGQRLVQAKTDTYDELKTFTEALELVKRNYVEDPSTQELVYGAIRGMLSSLDPHSSFMTERAYKEMGMDIRGEFQGVGIQIGVKNQQLMVISPIEDTPAERAGIAAGDKIIKINDDWTKDLSIEEAVDRMRGPKGTQVRLLIFREGWEKPKVFAITRAVIKVQSVKTRILDGDIGYLKITQFQGTTGAEVEKAMAKLKEKGMKRLVLDLRNNPGGVLDASVDVSSLFLPKGDLVVYLQGRNATDRKDYPSRGIDSFQKEPVVVLVNAGSASASEIVAGALQDARRAVILGTQTFGKGSVQTVFSLDGNVGMRLTTAKYYTPSGRSIQNVGIKPDLEVKLPSVKEPKDGDAVHAVLREKDLDRHLKNETAAEEDQKPEHSMEDMPLEMVPKDEKDDLQLQKAVELLKSGDIFKNIPVSAKKEKS